jgi:hypothetical protein
VRAFHKGRFPYLSFAPHTHKVHNGPRWVLSPVLSVVGQQCAMVL